MGYEMARLLKCLLGKEETQSFRFLEATECQMIWYLSVSPASAGRDRPLKQAI